MKKIVLTFGLISGAVISLMMLITVPFADKMSFETGAIIGYTTMVAAFLMVFFGIRSYRENVGGGRISFGKAFTVGILITLLACLFYVVTWEIVHDKFLPDFAEKYSRAALEKSRAAGATEEALRKQAEEMQNFWEMYKKPYVRIPFTLMEPLPVGLLITLISAAILRRKEPKPSRAGAAES